MKTPYLASIWNRVKSTAMQHEEEFYFLLTLAKKHNVRTVLEIGTNKGGLARAFLTTGVSVTSIDLCQQPEIETLLSINKSFIKSHTLDYSTSPATPLTQLNPLGYSLLLGDSKKVRPVYTNYDLLIIDGGHEYEDARADFENFYDYVRPGGLIAFHDISPFDGANHYGCAEFWNEIKTNKTHQEFHQSDIPLPKWGGWGIIEKPLA
jgi:hypothetical protein